MRWARAALAAAAVALVAAGSARAAPVSLVAVGTFAEPTYVTAVPGDASRLYVVERRGTVKVVAGGVARPFVDLSGLVGGTDGERGLLSIAFAPDFASTRRFYAYYTAKASGALTIARFAARDADSGDATPEVLLAVPHDRQSNHNGGQLQFGPDGLLYAGTGDGGAGDDQAGNGQNLSSVDPPVVGGVNHTPLLGKLLRLDVSPARGYAVPAANAFGPAGTAPELFAYGLRNPYRFSFDAGTGDLVVGDVGQNTREEVDLLPAGRPAGTNFGWGRWEGTLAHQTGATTGGVTFPVLEYPHGGSGFTGCSVTGGYVVRDPQLPELLGQYVFADYCTQGVRAATLAAGATADSRRVDLDGFTQTHVISFGEDACGRVHVATQDGLVERLSSGGGCTLRVAAGGPGAPGTSTAPGTPGLPGADAPDRRAPLVSVRRGRPQRAITLGRVRLTLRCDELCDLRAGGRFELGGRRNPRLVIRGRRGRLEANARVRLDLRSSRRTRQAVGRALRRGERVVARIVLRVRDTVGNSRTTVVRLRVRR